MKVTRDSLNVMNQKAGVLRLLEHQKCIQTAQVMAQQELVEFIQCK
jgi:hypothetical protein